MYNRCCVFKKCAFTLIELIVVISIISIILGIAIPRLSRSTQGTKLKSSAEMLKSVLETAKSYARTGNCDSSVVYNSLLHRIDLYRQDVDDANSNGNTVEHLKLDSGFDVSAGVVVSFSGGGPGSTIVFHPWGGISGNDALVTFSTKSGDKSKAVYVDHETGYVEIG